MMHALLFTAATLALSQPPSLDPNERAIVTAVEAGNPAALALLERAVNQNSGSHNHDGVKKVGEMFRAEFAAIGLDASWLDGATWQRAGHLVARKEGTGPHILLIGHLDTVFEPDNIFQKFERIDEHTARGPGIIDMKGGNVIILKALAALKATPAWPQVNVTVVMTGDEEDTGEPVALARKALFDAAATAKYAIGFENGSGDPSLAITARRGIARWTLEVAATAGHSSQVFQDDPGNGAVYEAARFVDESRRTLAGERYLSFNPGVFLGGTQVEYDAAASRGTGFGKSNVVAAKAVVSGDLRTISQAQLDATQAAMRKIAAASLPGAKSTLTFEPGYPALSPKPGNTKLLELYDRGSQDLGFGVVSMTDPERAGAADVAFIGDRVDAVLDGIGLMGHSDHGPGETADLRTLPSQTQRAALLLYRLTTAPR